MLSVYKYLYFALPRLRFIKSALGRQYLDFGCGNGVALRQNLAVRPDLACYAIDIKDCSELLPSGVIFRQYDGWHIPYDSGFFDIITCNHVLEHIADSKVIMSELMRVLKPGGWLFIEVPNEKSLWGKPGGRFAGTVNFYDDQTHARHYRRVDLIELGQASGFRLIKCRVARNWLYFLLSPLLLLFGLFVPKKLWFMYGRNNIIGWSSYIILQRK
jgi:SAM-dependent methyltransferase